MMKTPSESSQARLLWRTKVLVVATDAFASAPSMGRTQASRKEQYKKVLTLHTKP